jgi:uncharacterized membrane protein YphA (DoxX/SURF4 family)
MKSLTLIKWMLRLVAAAIMLQTLYFKFTAAPESVELFTLIGMEPWGRIGIGVGELIASILILVPRTTWLGALLGIGLMSGAVFFHIAVIGIFFGGDAILFSYALIVLVASSLLLYLSRKDLIEFVVKIYPPLKARI